MNTQQTQTCWLPALRNFARREWTRVFVWCAIGVSLAGIIHLFFHDTSFQRFICTKYEPFETRFDGFRAYLWYIVVAATAFAIATGLKGPFLITRGVRSWWMGVASGLPLLTFISTLTIFILFVGSLLRCLLFDLAAMLVFFASDSGDITAQKLAPV